MTLMIGGGNWRSFADVAHTLVTERQNAQSLALQARNAQLQAYLGRMGIQMRREEMDFQREQAPIQQQFRQDQLGEQQYQFDLQHSLNEAQSQRLQDEGSARIRDREMENAIKYGAIYDPNTNEYRMINDGDKLYDAHKSYSAARSETKENSMEIHRRMVHLRSRIAADERNEARFKQALQQKHDMSFHTGIQDPEGAKKLEEEIQNLSKRMNADRGVYSKLYEKYYGDYMPTLQAQEGDPVGAAAGSPGEPPPDLSQPPGPLPPPGSFSRDITEPASAAPPPAAGAAAAAPTTAQEQDKWFWERLHENFKQAAKDPDVQDAAAWVINKATRAGAAIAAPIDEAINSPHFDARGDMNRPGGEERAARTDKWQGRFDTAITGLGMAGRELLGMDKPDWTKSDLDDFLTPDILIENKPYFISVGKRTIVAKDLQKIRTKWDAAVKARNWELAAELNEERKNYYKNNMHYLTQRPPNRSAMGRALQQKRG